jgi:hypothetical protein
MRKQNEADILAEIEKEFREEERVDTVDDEFDSSGLKSWEVQFLRRGRIN